MKFTHTLSYDASPDDVYAMLRDPAFRERVLAAQAVVSSEVTLEPRDGGAGGFHLVVEQVQDTAGLPAIARKITGDTTRAVVEEDWAGPSGGTVSITAPGKPTSATGTVALEAAGAGTREVVELDVKVKVPLVGGKLEALMADNIEKGLDIEQTVGIAWLAGER
ncbi:Polyketide cyclase / dehydrase and lipid transport [Nocardioides dokdonensis FR1436]|uniref:Polyketide cyclase / dehydrase and lipid transport n=1 Tax=Nocardioides dokdonensis FR1436 TaxID=1300347 RepID=A0A1A9GK31_9ACTN|nr:DUF2505 domain-containing protein [Nocardioides dokdonensis]ANH38624.1 Polyketide cyclase / dehydrase and lipid transport [Nocardioides dokdonensis FR1436]